MHHPEKEDDMGTAANVEGTDTSEEEPGLTKLWKEVRELSLGCGSDVERLHLPPSPIQFLRDFVMPNKPCIITAGLPHWPALTKWTNAYLTSLLQNQIVSLHFTPNGRADSVVKSTINSDSCFVSAHVERIPFPAALEYIAGSEYRERGAVAYAQEQNGCFMSEYSLLAEDVDTDIPWATEALGSKPEAVNLWIGNERATTSFHKDHYENLYAVVSGEKHFLLLPPTDLHRMYIKEYPAAHYVRSEENGEFKIELDTPLRYVPWSSVDPYPPSSQAEQERMLFPRYFNGPKPFECTVRAGEMLYLPSLWFHHVKQTPDSEGRTIAINYFFRLIKKDSSAQSMFLGRGNQGDVPKHVKLANLQFTSSN